MFVATLLVVMASCSTTSQIIQTGDVWTIYDYGVEEYEKGEWKKAKKYFEAIETYFTGSMREDTLAFYKARCYFKMDDFYTSTMLFDEFRRKFGRSVFIEDVEGMYALSYYYMSPAPNRDQSSTRTAIMTINEFLARYPESEQVDVFKQLQGELVLRLHEKSYLNAYIYQKIGRYKSAIVAFRNALKEYPESEFREEILYHIVLSSYDLASNSILAKKEDRFLDMRDAYYTFIAEYPESEFRKEADKMELKARLYIEKQNKIREEGGVEDALIAEQEGRKAERKIMKQEATTAKAVKKEEKRLERAKAKGASEEELAKQRGEAIEDVKKKVKKTDKQRQSSEERAESEKAQKKRAKKEAKAIKKLEEKNAEK